MKLKFKKDINLDFEASEHVKHLLEKDDLDIVFKVTKVKQDSETIIIEEAVIKSVSVIKNSNK